MILHSFFKAKRSFHYLFKECIKYYEAPVSDYDYGLGYVNIKELHEKGDKVGWSFQPALLECTLYRHNFLVCSRRKSNRKKTLIELLSAQTRKDYSVDLKYVLQEIQIFTLNDEACLIVSDYQNLFTQSLTNN